MQILRAEPLRPRNTLRLCSNAAALASVSNEAELGDALAWARAEGLPVIPLGEGSNVVLAGDLEALVLNQQAGAIHPLQKQADRVVLRVEAGCSWHRLVTQSLQQGWYGLENLALIPGQLGAAPIQNIGAYGVELERFVRAVHAVRIDDGVALSLDPAECQFGYRDSIFKRELRDQVVITAVDMELSTNPTCDIHYPALREELAALGVESPRPQDVFNAVVNVRRRRLPDPAREPNAGSFFKNPVISGSHADLLRNENPGLPCYEQDDGSVKLPAAWLIEECGWKGQREGGVGVHPEHALVLVNYSASSGAQLLDFANRIAGSVESRFGVALDLEPRIYGA